MISRVSKVPDLRMRTLNSRGGRLETATFASSSGSTIVKVPIINWLRSWKYTVDANIFQGESEPSTIENDGEASELRLFELFPDETAISNSCLR